MSAISRSRSGPGSPRARRGSAKRVHEPQFHRRVGLHDRNRYRHHDDREPQPERIRCPSAGRAASPRPEHSRPQPPCRYPAVRTRNALASYRGHRFLRPNGRPGSLTCRWHRRRSERVPPATCRGPHHTEGKKERSSRLAVDHYPPPPQNAQAFHALPRPRIRSRAGMGPASDLNSNSLAALCPWRLFLSGRNFG
jgi:hypothetical protein